MALKRGILYRRAPSRITQQRQHFAERMERIFLRNLGATVASSPENYVILIIETPADFKSSLPSQLQSSAMSTNRSPLTQPNQRQYLEKALCEARKSPPKPSNFRVGCVIVSFESFDSPVILSTGYTLELEGNTHAEQCALSKLATSYGIPESSLPSVLSASVNAILYTTLEPCGKRLSGNTPCVQRIIATRTGNSEGGIRKVIFGAKEPGTFVQDSQSCRLLTDAGVDWEYAEGLDKEILEVAMEGHKPIEKPEGQRKEPSKQSEGDVQPRGTSVDNISQEERRRQEAQPRNPKKRMMEAPPGSG